MSEIQKNLSDQVENKPLGQSFELKIQDFAKEISQTDKEKSEIITKLAPQLVNILATSKWEDIYDLQELEDLQVMEWFFNGAKTKQLKNLDIFLKDEEFKEDKIAFFKSQINSILEISKNKTYVNEKWEVVATHLEIREKNKILKSTLEAQEKLKKEHNLSEPDEKAKMWILSDFWLKEEDLQAKIDQNPAYKEANLTPSQLISFFHTQNQISENPILKTQLSQNPDFIAFDKNFLKIQDDLNLYKPLRSNALERKTYDTWATYRNRCGQKYVQTWQRQHHRLSPK